ncbi:MAG TPA: VTT domain-containing protein, partial [Candidatus Omnitrophota bacterium]|nr:VTT domain-containing protein [Candidatus Omnitrophota bacterium]
MNISSGTRSFLVFIVLTIVFILIGHSVHLFDHYEHWRDFLAQRSPFLSSAVFIFIYVVSTFLIWFGPKDVLRVASVLVFGVWWSTLLVYIGETLNMVTLFWFSRRLGRGFVEEKARGRMKEIDEAVSNTSVPMIFFMKFYPVISFRFLDLGYGLTRISFFKYAAVSVVASPIRLFVIQYFIDLMMKFGLNSARDPAKAIGLVFEMTDYFMTRPVLFIAMEVYAFSGILFFAAL